MIKKYRTYRAVCPRCHKEAVVKIRLDKFGGLLSYEKESVYCDHFVEAAGQVVIFNIEGYVAADITHTEEEA